MPNAAPDRRAHFLNDINALIGTEAAASARFGVAVSGGPDSMALLYLCTKAFPNRTFAATVDHRLRPEARAEAEMVAAWCAGEGVPHAILTPSSPISGSVQAAARQARYALLEQWRTANGIDWLLTAHHADDQLETLLMRINRSSGVGGLAGIRARNGAVLRPLLGWRRAELAELVEAEGLPHIEDPSNTDPRFDRAALRTCLRDVDWLDPIAASRAASACADAEEALQWMVDDYARHHLQVGDDGTIWLENPPVPRELQRRLLVRMLALADPGADPPRGDTIDQAVVQLLCGKRITIGKWLLSGGKRWKLTAAPPRRVR